MSALFKAQLTRLSKEPPSIQRSEYRGNAEKPFESASPYYLYFIRRLRRQRADRRHRRQLDQ